MRIQCPKCKDVAPTDQVNMSTDLALCPRCNEAFKVSEAVDLSVVNEGLLHNPPAGTWFSRGIREVTIGASTRSPIALFLIPFTVVWSGGSLGGIYGSQIVSGKFDLLFSFFGLPFLTGSIILWAYALLTVCGKVVVTLRGAESRVFVGVGGLGWTRSFDWPAVQTIREEISHEGRRSGRQTAILLEGPTRLKFGTVLNEPRRYFVMNALKLLKMREQ